MQKKKPTGPPLSEVAQHKLWVLFHDGNNRTLYSYPEADKKGKGLTRLKTLVEERWKGRVAVAKIFNNQDGRLILEFHSRSDMPVFKPVEVQPQQSYTV
ncbi:hypothetical protein [Lewinella cohaerens]|uniref:hypothetical protein n=1 Tax=Lewinella cohaerens TaxID=70995 RepID=UPI000375BD0E|nr:hypothetical protein [Lewinella cohaerens]